MAKTKSEMFTLICANLPDNTTGLITPAKLREVMTQMADSPIYATPGVKEVEVLRAASTAGQTFAVQIMRDSAGSNFGGVYPQAAAVTAWGTAPSALLVISRLEAA